MFKIPESVRTLIKQGLLETQQIAATTALLDARQRWKFVSDTSAEAYIELHAGIRTYSSISSRIETLPICQRIDAAILDYCPELAGYIGLPTVGFKIPEAPSLLLMIYNRITQFGASLSDAAVDEIFLQIETAFNLRSIPFELFSPIRALRLPDGINEIELDEFVKIRSLSQQESEGIFNEMAADSPRGFHSRIASAIIVTGISPIEFSLNGNNLPTGSFSDDNDKVLKDVICSLMIVSNGKPAIEYKRINYPSMPIGYESGRSSSLQRGFIFVEMQLTADDIPKVVETYKLIRRNQNVQIKIALDRLNRSEDRYAATDSLIDAVIGLEAILTPDSNSEMTYRAKLHYSLISPLDQRKARFSALGKIMTVRGNVVHGKTPNETELKSISDDARDCLKFAVRWCLGQHELVESTKFPDQFWTDYALSLIEPS